MFTLSAFGDEIADDLAEQLALLRRLNVGYLELRAAWGKNVLRLSDDEAAQVAGMCAAQGIAVSVIGSPVGKSPLADPIEVESANLRRIFQIAEAVGTRSVRIFSFYPPDTTSKLHHDQYVDDVIARLSHLSQLAADEGFYLFLENENGIVGDTLERCQRILDGVASPHLRFAWDPANFVQVGELRAVERGWPLLGAYVGHVHVKDALSSDGSVRVAGQGDGQVALLLSNLREAGYQGFLALEPHLAIAGHSSGFSGVDGMTYAVETLRASMRSLGCEESQQDWAEN